MSLGCIGIFSPATCFDGGAGAEAVVDIVFGDDFFEVDFFFVLAIEPVILTGWSVMRCVPRRVVTRLSVSFGASDFGQKAQKSRRTKRHAENPKPLNLYRASTLDRFGE